MKAVTAKAKKQNESRAAAHSVFQKKRDQKGASGAADNRTIPAAHYRTTTPNGPARSSKSIGLNAPPRASNIIQGYFAAPKDDWQSFIVRVPQNAVISEEKQAYLKKKIQANGGWGNITIEKVQSNDNKINDKDYLYLVTTKTIDDVTIGQETPTKIELSDILPTYNAKLACVLQALIKLKGNVFGKSSPSDLHDHIYEEEDLAAYREYDLDDVYPALYKKVGLAATAANDGKLKDIVQGLTVGKKYIFEATPMSAGTSGHNFVVDVKSAGSRGKKTGQIIQDGDNTEDIADGQKIKNVWA